MPPSPLTPSFHLPSLFVYHFLRRTTPHLFFSAISIPCPTLRDAYSSHRRELLYLGGDSASEQYGVAEIEGGGVGEDAEPVPAMGCHAEGAVPLVQGEEERGEVQRDENTHPHGPVEGPHEGSDGGRSVPATNLVGQRQKNMQETGLMQLFLMQVKCILCKIVIIIQPPVLVSERLLNTELVFLHTLFLFLVILF